MKKSEITKRCQTCNKEFITYTWRIKRGWGKFCSHSCRSKQFAGKNNPAYKEHHEPSISPNGYIKIWVGFKKYELEHRLIMEKHLDRKLGRYELVHHIKGDKKDNRIENLELVNGLKEHNNMHPRERNVYGQFI